MTSYGLAGGIRSLTPNLSPLSHVQRWGNRTARGSGSASSVRGKSGICKSLPPSCPLTAVAGTLQEAKKSWVNLGLMLMVRQEE